MAIFNAAFPIVPGKVEAARAFARETLGARRSKYEDHQRRRGVTGETWSIQETPDGNAFSVVWTRVRILRRRSPSRLATPQNSPAWFRERVKEINGIELDPNGPLPDVPEVTLDWKA